MAIGDGDELLGSVYDRFPVLKTGRETSVIRSILNKTRFDEKTISIPGISGSVTGRQVFENLSGIEMGDVDRLTVGHFNPTTKKIILSGGIDDPSKIASGFFHELGHSVGHITKSIPGVTHDRRALPASLYYPSIGMDEGQADAFMKRMGEMSGQKLDALGYMNLDEYSNIDPRWGKAMEAGMSGSLRPALAHYMPGVNMKDFITRLNTGQLNDDELKNLTAASQGYDQGYRRMSGITLSDSSRPAISISGNASVTTGIAGAGVAKAGERIRPVIRLNAASRLSHSSEEVAKAVTMGSKAGSLLRSAGLKRLLRI